MEFAANDGPKLSRPWLRALARLSAAVASTFGGPQDVEWAIGRDETLWLLQSRPVTSEVRGVPRGPIYGPGPVAETFPEPLTELERDLWGPAAAGGGAGGGAAGRVRAPQGAGGQRGGGGHRRPRGHRPEAGRRDIAAPQHRAQAQPVPALGRLRGAWRAGRLRAAPPRLSEDLLDRVDADLEAVPALHELTSRQLIALLHRGRTILRALHAHEILMGMLTDTGGNRMTGVPVALRVLVEAREDGLSDEEILNRSLIVLALVAPKVALPRAAARGHRHQPGPDGDSGNDNGILREALRLRVRWMQELSGRAAWTLGERLAASGDLTEPSLIRHMNLELIEAVATNRAVVVPKLVAAHEHDYAPPPAWFQISDTGRPIRAQCGAGSAAAPGPAAAWRPVRSPTTPWTRPPGRSW